MQDIYSYIPETKNVSRTYSVAAVLYLQFVLHVMFFRSEICLLLLLLLLLLQLLLLLMLSGAVLQNTPVSPKLALGQ